MDDIAINENTLNNEQGENFASVDNEVNKMPFNFRGEFKQFYKKSAQVEKAYVEISNKLNDLTTELQSKGFEEFYDMNGLRGELVDLNNVWMSALDIANKVNGFLDGGLSNKDINELNKFITIAKSSQETKENFEIFCKSLEQTNDKLKIFNEEIEKYAVNETIQVLKNKNKEIIAKVNEFCKKQDMLFADMFEAKKLIIDHFSDDVEKTRNNLIKIHKDVENKISNLDEIAKDALESFDSKFKAIFDNKLVTWQNLNVSDYKKFTKFAFGFYTLNFCFALILGILGASLINAKKTYDIQAEILKETNSAFHFLVDNGDLELKKDGTKTILNFVAKQNLTIKHDGKIVKLTLNK